MQVYSILRRIAHVNSQFAKDARHASFFPFDGITIDFDMRSEITAVIVKMSCSVPAFLSEA